MSFILTSRTRDRQPQGPIYANKINADVIWTPQHGGVLSGGGAYTSDRNGLAVTTGYVALQGNSPASLYATTWTEIGSAYLDLATRVVTLSNRVAGQTVYFSSTKVQAVIWNIAEVPLSGGAPPSGLVNYVMRRVGSTHTLWINGVLFGSASESSTPNSSSVAPAIGADAAAGGYAGSAPLYSSRIYLVARTPQGLSTADCLALSRNPWQLFAPQRTPVFYSIAGVSPGPSTANRIMLLRRPGLSRAWR